MDDVQLKALLDEAITYRNPRDVEDKSDTFKVSWKHIFYNCENSSFSSCPSLTIGLSWSGYGLHCVTNL